MKAKDHMQTTYREFTNYNEDYFGSAEYKALSPKWLEFERIALHESYEKLEQYIKSQPEGVIRQLMQHTTYDGLRVITCMYTSGAAKDLKRVKLCMAYGAEPFYSAPRHWPVANRKVDITSYYYIRKYTKSDLDELFKLFNMGLPAYEKEKEVQLQAIARERQQEEARLKAIEVARQQQETARLKVAEMARQQQEEARLKAIEMARQQQEEARLKVAEMEKQRQQEEKAKQEAEENKKKQELQRLAEEQKQLEQIRLAEEKRKREETRREVLTVAGYSLEGVQIALDLFSILCDRWWEYANAKPNSHKDGVGKGLSLIVFDVASLVRHPIDNFFYPVSEFFADTVIIAAEHNVRNSTDPDVAYLKSQLMENPQWYTDAKTRMKERGDNIGQIVDYYLYKAEPEEYTREVTRILVPGIVIKAARGMIQVHRNLKTIGQLDAPLFDIKRTWMDGPIKLKTIKKLSIAEVREHGRAYALTKNPEGWKNDPLIYVIRENGELVITKDMVHSPLGVEKTVGKSMPHGRELTVGGATDDFYSQLKEMMRESNAFAEHFVESLKKHEESLMKPASNKVAYDHWDLGEGKPVRGGGAVYVNERGEIVFIDNCSGSYAPNFTFFFNLGRYVEKIFIENGLPDAKGKFVDWKVTNPQKSTTPLRPGKQNRPNIKRDRYSLLFGSGAGSAFALTHNKNTEPLPHSQNLSSSAKPSLEPKKSSHQKPMLRQKKSGAFGKQNRSNRKNYGNPSLGKRAETTYVPCRGDDRAQVFHSLSRKVNKSHLNNHIALMRLLREKTIWSRPEVMNWIQALRKEARSIPIHIKSYGGYFSSRERNLILLSLLEESANQYFDTMGKNFLFSSTLRELYSRAAEKAEQKECQEERQASPKEKAAREAAHKQARNTHLSLLKIDKECQKMEAFTNPPIPMSRTHNSSFFNSRNISRNSNANRSNKNTYRKSNFPLSRTHNSSFFNSRNISRNSNANRSNENTYRKSNFPSSYLSSPNYFRQGLFGLPRSESRSKTTTSFNNITSSGPQRNWRWEYVGYGSSESDSTGPHRKVFT